MKTLQRFMSLVLILAFVSAGCGGGAARPVPEEFDKLSKAANAQSSKLAKSADEFAQKFNALSEFDPTTVTDRDVVKPLEELVAAGDRFIDDLEYYDELIDAYGKKTASASLSKGVNVFKQSADPFLVLDIKNLIEAGRSEAEAINEMIEKGADWNEVHDAMNEYKKKHMAEAFNTGVTAVVGGGAGVIAGLATAAAGAPVLVVAGAAIGTGLLVGAIWSWCTSPSKKSVKADGSGEVCMMAAVEGEAIELPDGGGTGVALTLPEGGPGNLCLHAPGMAPVCVQTTIDPDGNKITTCFVEATADAAEAAKACQDETETGEQDVQGANCETDIKSLNASATVVGNATITVVTNLPTEGCTISWSVVGTDGYTDSGTPLTNENGRISFTIPEGDPGVYDAVTIEAPQSGASTFIGYTF